MKLSEGATKKTRQLRNRGNVIHELYSRRSRAELSSVSDFARRVVLLLLWLPAFSPSVIEQCLKWHFDQHFKRLTRDVQCKVSSWRRAIYLSSRWLLTLRSVNFKSWCRSFSKQYNSTVCHRPLHDLISRTGRQVWICYLPFIFVVIFAAAFCWPWKGYITWSSHKTQTIKFRFYFRKCLFFIRDRSAERSKTRHIRSNHRGTAPDKPIFIYLFDLLFGQHTRTKP